MNAWSFSKSAVGAVFAALSCCVFTTAQAADAAHPLDSPVGVTAKQMEALQQAIRPYVEKARATYPEAKARFLSGLPSGSVFFVTAPLHGSNGLTEQVFVFVTAIREGRIYGKIASEISLVTQYHRGDTYDLPEAELLDWTISKRDGSEEGNFVGKFLDTYHPQ